jgi:membrane associated rhomboid family serine protease
MIPVRDVERSENFPFVTFTIIVLLVVIYLWDRGWSLFGPRYVFADLAARPVDVISALRGQDIEPFKTLFTACFLHANLWHLLGNLLFLWVFGPRVEREFGPFLFCLLYLFWGIFATLVQVFVTPQSGVPMLGASGAIAGVMGSFLLLFPAARIATIIPPFVFNPVEMPAWLLLGLWFILQLVVAQPGVANWAHAGGFLGGMMVVFIMGRGRRRPPSFHHAI